MPARRLLVMRTERERAVVEHCVTGYPERHMAAS
jgi:hypothetical protein